MGIAEVGGGVVDGMKGLDMAIMGKVMITIAGGLFPLDALAFGDAEGLGDQFKAQVDNIEGDVALTACGFYRSEMTSWDKGGMGVIVFAVLAIFEDLSTGDNSQAVLVSQVMIADGKGGQGNLMQEEMGNDDQFLDLVEVSLSERIKVKVIG